MARPRGKRTCGIYAITCRPTGHVYVGGSLHVEQRLRVHKSRLEAGDSHNKVLQFAWDVFGSDEFQFEVLEECTPSKLRSRELHHLRAAKKVFNILKDARRPPTFNEQQRKRLAERARKQHKDGNFGRQTWRKR